MAAKRKTSKASAKKGLKNLSQIHGEEEKFQPTSLDQVWGEDGSSTYGTMNDAEYAQGSTPQVRILHAFCTFSEQQLQLKLVLLWYDRSIRGQRC